ncbi:unnamed protein product [Arabis nemorensis]|uniref:Ribonucleotide reductase large subunit C-terminal domain-containing protein n=1 Tax=Arabis nemorensis TaxID=586526 RepID=A0A565AR83_9BRAS|nr:unnamed protein product [Arabis nemorensis]
MGSNITNLLRKYTGLETCFYALWVPDLFMERVHSDGQWSLFCPNESLVWQIVGALNLRHYTRRQGQEDCSGAALWYEILTSQV